MKKQDAKSETAKRIARTEAYAEKVRQQFALTVNEILALNKSMPTLDEGVMFSFDDQSMKVQKQVEELLRQLHSVATMAIKKGITLEWEQANIECDKLVQSCFGKKVLSSPEFAAWTQRNENARDAFIARSDNGLNLSDRVWQSVRQLRDEMEVAMTVAIGEGDSAASMSRKVREYLNEPDLMFRRFRYKDAETGEWKRKWKKRIKDETTGKYKWIDYNRDDYKTGAGVYKSSAKNAMRVARTETNIAYRRADNERWQQMDFVLGQRIQLSHNHPKKDICDKLQGDYPAEFVFDGWHPQCFCFATPILMDEEEMAKVTEAFLRGEKYTPKGKKITSYPQNFKDWVTEHSEQIAASRDRGTEPYFIKNNAAVIDNILNPKDEPLSIAEIAAKRHAERTPEKEKQLREYWEKKKAEGDARRKNETLVNTTANNVLAAAEKRGFTEFAEIDTTALQDAIKSGDTALIKTQTKALASQMAVLQKQIKSDAQSMITKASDFGEIDATALSKAITSSKLSEIKMKMNALQAQINAVEAQEQAISDLIPNVHALHKTYSISELEKAHSELDSVIKKWLSKYGYSSIDTAPLDHLRNKLDFELNNPTISYSQKEIIKKAITEKILLVNQKIEWNNLVQKAASLQSFKTKSPTFKGLLAKIDDAIQRNDFNSLQQSISDAEAQQQKLIEKQIKRCGDKKTALNKEYKGGAVGKDISSSIDTSTMVSEDPYRSTFTNNVARLQGFDAPAKLVSEAEFDRLEKVCGDVFYRTVNPTTFKGKDMTSAEFASQLYVADLLELNGPGGRVYGDGMYVATSAWDGYQLHSLTDSLKQNARRDSECYGHGRHTLSEMTWTRKPKIIKQSDLQDMWSKLTTQQRRKFGNHENTYACALGYDAMYCDGPNYMVIWNRSIIAVKKK